MSGRIQTAGYDLVSCLSGDVVGRLLADGTVTSEDPVVSDAVKVAFSRELLVRDGELVEELGVCFDGVETLRPGDAGHWTLVLTHLGALAGVFAQRRTDDGLAAEEQS